MFKSLRKPCLTLAVAVTCMFALPNTDPIVSPAAGQSATELVSQADLANLPVKHFEQIARQIIKPVAHTTPLELDAQSFTVSFVPNDG
jgi:hypothetical protein